VSREAILWRVRSALRRTEGQAAPPPPELYLPVPAVDLETRIASFTAALEALSGRVIRVARPAEARSVVADLIGGASAVASDSAFLRACGIPSLPGVCWEFASAAALRQARAEAEFGITSAHYALADTGSLVLMSGFEESRLVSLLPPKHIAVVPESRLISGLDELLTLVPTPADRTSAMTIITGPSRTADIEQILVRGVHGPGVITVIFVAASA